MSRLTRRKCLISFSSSIPGVVIIFVLFSKMTIEKCFLIIKVCAFTLFSDTRSVITSDYEIEICGKVDGHFVVKCFPLIEL